MAKDDPGRAERLAEALRANLRRRKAQAPAADRSARDRVAPAGRGGPDPPPARED